MALPQGGSSNTVKNPWPQTCPEISGVDSQPVCLQSTLLPELPVTQRTVTISSEGTGGEGCFLFQI